MLCHRRRERLLQGKRPSDLRKSGQTGNTFHPLHKDVHEHVLGFTRSYSHYSTNSCDAFIQGYHCVADLWKNWLFEHEPEVYEAFKKNNTWLTYGTTMRDIPPSLQSLFKPKDVNGVPQPCSSTQTLQLQVSYQHYASVFHQYFLEFEKFKDDQCLACNAFRNQLRAYRSTSDADNANATIRQDSIQSDWNEHRRIADHGYEWRREHAKASFASLHPEPDCVEAEPEANDVEMPEFNSKPHAKVFVEMDKGGGLKVPFLRDSFVYFKRTNLAYLYYFCNTGSNTTTIYGWNETYSKSGPNEMVSMYYDYYTKFRTGASHFEAWVDGCGGQLWNRHFLWAVADSCNPLSHSYDDRDNTSSMWRRADIYRNLRGHTFQRADRAHGVVRKAINRSEFVAGLDDLLDNIIPSADKKNPYNVQKLDDKILHDTKAYSKQFYIWRKTIDGEEHKIRSARWMNFAIGEIWDEASQKYITQEHPYEVWLRDTLDPKEQPRRVNIMKFCNANGTLKKSSFDLNDNRMHQFAQQDMTLPEIGYKLIDFPLHAQERHPLPYKKRKDLHACAQALPETLLKDSNRKAENKRKDEYGDDLMDIDLATLRDLYPLDPDERDPEGSKTSVIGNNDEETEEDIEEEEEDEEDDIEPQVAFIQSHEAQLLVDDQPIIAQSTLTSEQIYRMKVVELRAELALRKQETKGLKVVLQNRLATMCGITLNKK